MRKHLLNVAEMRHKAGAFLLDILSAEGDHPIGIPALVCITEPTANPHTGKAGVHNVGIVGGTRYHGGHLFVWESVNHGGRRSCEIKLFVLYHIM